MKLVPIGDKIVVKRLEADEVTSGGIVLPSSAQEKPQQGRVVAVGAGRRAKDGKRVTPQVAEGDRVVFSAYSGTEIELDGQKILIMDEGDIVAILD